MNEWLTASNYKDIWRFTDALITKLIRPEYRKLQETINHLVLKNAEATGKAALAFTQDGLVYKHTSMVHQPDGISWRPALSFSLASEFQEYKKHLNQLSDQKAVMRQTLVLLFHPTQSLQELRDSTPEYLVHFVPEFKDVPRQQDVLALVTGNERLVRQFKKSENLMKLHAAGHLLY